MKLFIFDMGGVVAHNVAVEGAVAKAVGMSGLQIRQGGSRKNY